MSYPGQIPYAYAYPNLPPPVPQPGHYLVPRNPPFAAPKGHRWVPAPPPPDQGGPYGGWTLEPVILLNERQEGLTMLGEFFRSPVPPSNAPGMQAPALPITYGTGSRTLSGTLPPEIPLFSLPDPTFAAPSAPRPSPAPASDLPNIQIPTIQVPAPNFACPIVPPLRPPTRRNSRDSRASASLTIVSPTHFLTTQATRAPAAPTSTLSPTAPEFHPTVEPPTPTDSEPDPRIPFRHVRFIAGDVSRVRTITASPSPQPGQSPALTPYEPVYLNARRRPTSASQDVRNDPGSNATSQPSPRGRTPHCHHRRSRSPSPYPTRLKPEPSRSHGRNSHVTSTPHDLSSRARTPHLGARSDLNAAAEYPPWLDCERCGSRPATRERGDGVRSCYPCSWEGWQAEVEMRRGR